MEPEYLISLLPEGLVPWEILCQRTAKSRAELEGGLHELQAQGFPILLEEEGAGLAWGTPAPHLLFPRLKGKLGWPCRYLGTVTSTQDVLGAWEGAPVGALVVAERQTQGRGRQGRRWESPAGNLYFSLLLGPDVDDWLPLRAGVALAESTQVGWLQWPNDLLAPNRRKLGGILVERSGERTMLGVGLNINTAPLPTAAALRQFFPVHRAQLLADFLWALEKWLEEETDAVRRAWKDRSLMFGQTVVVRCGNEQINGIAWDLGPQGELILHTDWGFRLVTAGDVQLSAAEDVEDPKVSEGEPQCRGSGHSQGEGPRPSAQEGQGITHGGVRKSRDEEEKKEGWCS